MTDDEMRKAWADLDRRVRRIEMNGENTPQPLNLSRRRTALDRLAADYLRFSVLALVFIPLTIANLFMLRYLTDTTRIILTCGFAGFFLITFVMDNWLYRGIRSIDIYSMSVEKVSFLARFYKKWHLRFMIFTCPAAAILVGALIYASSSDPYLIAGCCAGLAVGLAIGLKKFLKFISNYRELIEI